MEVKIRDTAGDLKHDHGQKAVEHREAVKDDWGREFGHEHYGRDPREVDRLQRKAKNEAILQKAREAVPTAEKKEDTAPVAAPVEPKGEGWEASPSSDEKKENK